MLREKIGLKKIKNPKINFSRSFFHEVNDILKKKTLNLQKELKLSLKKILKMTYGSIILVQISFMMVIMTRKMLMTLNM